MSNSLFRKKSIDKILKDAEEGLVDDQHHHSGLKKVLNVRDLTFMGIAAVIGAGIFSTIGTAASNGGPGISLLFVLTAVTCGFSALCYAEFASRVPIAGSAGAQPGMVIAAGPDGIDVACGAGALRLLEVQRPGARRMSVREFLAGHPVAPNMRMAARSDG